MNESKFRKKVEKFPFLDQVVKEISCRKVSVDEAVNIIDKIEVQQIGQKLLSRCLRSQYWFNKSDSGTEEDNYDHEKLFIVDENEKVENGTFSALESDYGFPLAHFFTERQPKYLVIVRIIECDWFHYYDKVGGRNIYKLEINIFLVDKNITNISKEIINRFWE